MQKKANTKKAKGENNEKLFSPISYNQYKSRLLYDAYLNRPIFKIFSDYFNIIKEDAEMQKKHGIKVLGFIRDNEFKDNITLHEGFGPKTVIIQFEELVVNFIFDITKSNNEIYYYIIFSSNEKTNIDSDSFYNKVWGHAVDVSDLKGSYFVMERDEIFWTKKNLEKRSFSDIYLPSSIIDDLKLYVEANSQAGKLMRYLMAGNPGTGKTESTLVLANELNKMGVTIIKTPVCSMIKDKVQLASLLAPALIIFDDIDLSLGARNKGVHSERLQDFLDVMDGTDKLGPNVGILATTNSVALLDLAAQRPGRFDKTLAFDELTLSNIRDIILKSLKYNFQLKNTHEISKMFIDSKIIRLFSNARVTGAHIFNSVHMLKMRVDLLKLDLSVEFILDELAKEIKTIDKTRKSDFLQDKLSGATTSIGFNNDEESEDLEEVDFTQVPLTKKNIEEALNSGLFRQRG